MQNYLTIYPKDLGDYIRKTNYIPKIVKDIKDIKKFAKYIYLEACQEGFKIEDIIDVNDQVYYQINLLNSHRQAVIPFEEKFNYFELLSDKSNIRKKSNIINSNEAFYGSEIKYWFFINNIDLYSKKYEGFRPIVTKSGFTISDKKLYFLKAEYIPSLDTYIHCRAVLTK